MNNIFLLDIDGTLCGDVIWQVFVWEMFNEINKTKQQKKINYSKKILQSKLKSGLVRPYFKQFFEACVLNNVQIFIYTASETRWATFLIKNIEEAFNIKFNKPIFTRKHCKYVNGDYVKSISHVAPMILRSLRKNNKNLTYKDIIDKIIPIDNNHVYNEKDDKRLIYCKTYSYIQPENIPSLLNVETYVNNYRTIYTLFHKYGFFNMIRTKSFLKFEKQYYELYIDVLNRIFKMKEDIIKDNLFKLLRKVVNMNKNITENFVALINTKLSI